LKIKWVSGRLQFTPKTPALRFEEVSISLMSLGACCLEGADTGASAVQARLRTRMPNPGDDGSAMSEPWESDDEESRSKGGSSSGSSAEHDLREYGIYPQLALADADEDAAAYLRSVRCALQGALCSCTLLLRRGCPIALPCPTDLARAPRKSGKRALASAGRTS